MVRFLTSAALLCGFVCVPMSAQAATPQTLVSAAVQSVASYVYGTLCPLFGECVQAPEAHTDVATSLYSDVVSIPNVTPVAVPVPSTPVPPPQVQVVYKDRVVEKPVETRVVERVVEHAGVSQGYVDTSLASLRTFVESRLAALPAPTQVATPQVVYVPTPGVSNPTHFVDNNTTLSQRIDTLTDTRITNPTITGGSIAGMGNVGANSLSISNGSALSGGLTVAGGASLDTLTVSGNLTTALTQGSVPFVGTGGVLSQDNGALFWNAGNKRLGVGTANPQASLDVRGRTLLGPNGDWEIDADGHMNWYNLLSFGWPIDQAGGVNYIKVAGGNSHSIALGSFDDGAMYLSGGTSGVYLYTAGSPRARIDSSGNFGVGTTSPASRLEVKGTTTDSTASALNVTDSGGNSKLFVRNDGNVGIGTTSPIEKLEVSGGNLKIGNVSNVWQYFYSGGAAKFTVGYRSADDNYVIGTGGADWLTVDRSTGYVGINTTSPTSTLDVNGNVNASSINGQLISNGGQTSGLVVGASTTIAGDRSVAIGNSANTTAADGTSVGYAATAGIYGSAFGRSATATGSGGVAIGYGTNVSGAYGLALGFGARASSGGVALGANSDANAISTTGMAFGRNAVVNANGQVVFGAPGLALTDYYLGSGVTDTTPTSATINATGASGTDISGADLSLAGGKPTGAGNGGSVIFKTASAGTTGTTLGTLSERMRITSTGNVGIGTTTPDTQLHVKTTSSTNVSQFKLTNFATGITTGEIWLQNLASGGHDFAVGHINSQDSFSIRDLTASGAPQRFMINASGNVGIGTTAPSQKLTVQTGTQYDGITLNNGTNIIAEMSGLTASNDQGYFALRNGNTRKIELNNNGWTLFNGGNVGINTTTPTNLLTLGGGNIQLDNNQNVGFKNAAGTAYQALSVDTANNLNLGSTNFSGGIGMYSNGGQRMTVDTSGNVNIGGYTNATNTLRYLDVQNSDTGSSAGAILRLVTNNSSSTGNVSVDMVKYKSGGFFINNNDTAGYTALGTAGSERLRITPSGNVGIGTSNPQTTLDVNGNIAAFQISNYPTNTTNKSGMVIGTGGSDSIQYYASYVNGGHLFHTGSSTNTLTYGARAAGWFALSATPVGMAIPGTTFTVGGHTYTVKSSEGNYIYTVEDASGEAATGTVTGLAISPERMRITSSGNVGIGTMSPDTALVVAGANSPTLKIVTTNDANYNVKFVTNYDSTKSFQMFANTLEMMRYNPNVNGLSLMPVSGSVGIAGTPSWGTLDVNGAVRVGTSSLAPAANVALAAIYTGGGTQWGAEFRPTTAGASTPIYFTNSAGTSQGNISITGSGSTAYNSTSDRRTKENIIDTTLNLNTLLRLPVRDFSFKTDPTHKTSTGFIAQEMKDVFPDAVTTNGDDGVVPLSDTTTPWSVDYGRVTPLLVKAVQDVAHISSVFRENLVAWLADVNNGIQDIRATHTVSAERVCVKKTDGTDVCINGDQLASLLTSVSTPPATLTPPPAPNDTIPPSVVVLGEAEQTITVGTQWSDLGATATDETGVVGSITATLDGNDAGIAGQVSIDTSTPSNHTVTYSATDAAGNVGTATRIVHVVAPETAGI